LEGYNDDTGLEGTG